MARGLLHPNVSSPDDSLICSQAAAAENQHNVTMIYGRARGYIPLGCVGLVAAGSGDMEEPARGVDVSVAVSSAAAGQCGGEAI